jgi:hypothetical protein
MQSEPTRAYIATQEDFMEHDGKEVVLTITDDEPVLPPGYSRHQADGWRYIDHLSALRMQDEQDRQRRAALQVEAVRAPKMPY